MTWPREGPYSSFLFHCYSRADQPRSHVAPLGLHRSEPRQTRAPVVAPVDLLRCQPRLAARCSNVRSKTPGQPRPRLETSARALSPALPGHPRPATLQAAPAQDRHGLSQFYRWLCPGAEIAARFYEKKGQPPAGFETIDQFYARSEIIPHVPVNDLDHAPAIKALFTKRAARGRH
jgi:hypothetical protein